MPQPRATDRSDAEVVEASWADGAEFGEIFERHFDVIFGYLAQRVARDARTPGSASQT